MNEIIRGVIPVAPTIFSDTEDLDLAGQRRVLDYLIDGGSDAVCILANYSEQFSLSDDERTLVTETTLEHAAGRIPVIVTASHYSARVTRERCQDAQSRGARMVMLMAPFFGATMTVEAESVVDYFKRVADGLDIDIMIQDAPMSSTPLSVSTLTRLAEEIPQVRYAKIEMPRTAAKIRALINSAGESLPGIYDGEEAITLIPDLDAGAQGTMTSCMVPDELGQIVRDYRAGRRDHAVEAWERLLPLIHYENRQAGLTAAKYLMKEGGIIACDATRAPFPTISEPTARELKILATRHDVLALRWA